MNPKSYTSGELILLAVAGKRPDPMRVLATYADEKNWEMVTCNQRGNWAWVGPVIVGYEFAENIMRPHFPGKDDDPETITLPRVQWSAIVLALGLVDRQRAWGPDCHAAKNAIMEQRDQLVRLESGKQVRPTDGAVFDRDGYPDEDWVYGTDEPAARPGAGEDEDE